jgi:hypothetical protein
LCNYCPNRTIRFERIIKQQEEEIASIRMRLIEDDDENRRISEKEIAQYQQLLRDSKAQQQQAEQLQHAASEYISSSFSRLLSYFDSGFLNDRCSSPG